MRTIRERLLDILDAVEKIERYAARGRDAFDKDELIQTWIMHHIGIIGEAASKLGRGFHKRHPQIQWPLIIAMRNLLVHHYFAVDMNEVWMTTQQDLPILKVQIATILENESKNNP